MKTEHAAKVASTDLLVAKNWNPGATSMQSSLPGIVNFLFSIRGSSTEI